MQKPAHPESDNTGPDVRGRGKRLLEGVAGRYRVLRHRLAELIGRGDRDYATLGQLSQEIGRIRQSIRADIERRRTERKRRNAAEQASKGSATAGSRRKAHVH